MRICCLHKDSIKENLYELLELSTLEDSKRIGAVSSALLVRLAEEQLSNGADIIIESPFNFPEDYPIFASWEEKYRTKIFSVLCRIEEEERQRRYGDRLPERHHCHHDDQRIDSGEVLAEKDHAVYDGMPGMRIEVVTDRPIGILADEVTVKINHNER